MQAKANAEYFSNQWHTNVTLDNDPDDIQREKQKEKEVRVHQEQELVSLRAQLDIEKDRVSRYEAVIAELQDALRVIGPLSEDQDYTVDDDELTRLKKRLGHIVVAKSSQTRQHCDEVARLKNQMQRECDTLRLALAQRSHMPEKRHCGGHHCDETVVDCSVFILSLMDMCHAVTSDLSADVGFRRQCDTLANSLDSWNSKRPVSVVPRLLLERLYTLSGEWKDGKPLRYEKPEVLVIDHSNKKDTGPTDEQMRQLFGQLWGGHNTTNDETRSNADMIQLYANRRLGEEDGKTDDIDNTTTSTSTSTGVDPSDKTIDQ